MHSLKNITLKIYTKMSGTFLRILLYILIAMSLLLLIFSQRLYNQYEKTVLQLSYQYNEKVLHYLTYNINYMNEMVKNFCVTQYTDSDNVHLMYSDKEDSYYIQRNINKFNKTLESHTMYFSAVLYNNKIKQFYSTYRGAFYDDQQLIHLMENKDNKPLTPIPRTLSKEKYFQEKNVFTYMIYDHIANNGLPDSALIVNVKTDWLFENMEKLNDNNIRYIIIDEEGNTIADGSNELPLFKPLKRDYLENILYKTRSKNMISMINNEKYVVTYFPIENTNWILISEQPYQVVFNHIKVIRNKTLAITGIFLILAILISGLVAKNIYRPFGNLVKQVKENFKDYFPGQNYRDDTEYLSLALRLGQSKMKDYENYKNSTESIINENFMKALLIENNFVNTHRFKQNQHRMKEIFEDYNNHMMLLLKIDKYKTFTKKEFEGIIINIIKEKFQNQCDSKAIYLGKGEFIVFLNVTGIDIDNLIYEVHRILRRIQLDIIKDIHITFSVFIGYIIEDPKNIHTYYQELQRMCRYRLIYGSSCIIDQSIDKRHHQEKNMDYPLDVQKKILDSLKMGHLDETEVEFNNFIISISERKMDYFILALLRLSLAIQSESEKITMHNHIDFTEFNSNLMSMETLEEINSAFRSIFELIIHEQETQKKEVYDIFINSILDYINIEYSHKELSLKKIAAEFKMSSVYLGKLFKNATGKSVADYINEVRLSKVIQLLEDTQYNIRQIMNKTGYDNESNFYKIFKKNFGITPKQYRMTALIEGSTKN